MTNVLIYGGVVIVLVLLALGVGLLQADKDDTQDDSLDME